MDEIIISMIKFSYFVGVHDGRFALFGNVLTQQAVWAKSALSFGFAKSSQIQNHLFIKPNAQIRCSSCYQPLTLINISFFQNFFYFCNFFFSQIPKYFCYSLSVNSSDLVQCNLTFGIVV